jgi:hypothetical protein
VKAALAGGAATGMYAGTGDRRGYARACGTAK